MKVVCKTREHLAAVFQKCAAGLEGGPVQISYGRPKRTDEQNQKMWAMAQDISKQHKWDGEYISKDEWVTLFTAVVTNTKLLRGLEGGIVPAVRSTRRLTKGELSDVIEYMYAWGADNDIVWRE